MVTCFTAPDGESPHVAGQPMVQSSDGVTWTQLPGSPDGSSVNGSNPDRKRWRAVTHVGWLQYGGSDGRLKRLVCLRPPPVE